jgi:hypothetical protein
MIRQHPIDLFRHFAIEASQPGFHMAHRDLEIISRQGGGSGGIAVNQDQVWAMYVTDNWRVNRRVTVNWGIRYDRQHPWVPAQSSSPMSANDDPTGLFKGGSFAKQDGFALYQNTVPRLGVSWDIDGKGRNVAKASYSLYTGTSVSTSGYLLNGGKTITFNFRDLDGNRDFTPGIGEVNFAQYTPGCLSVKPTTCPDVVTEPSTTTLPVSIHAPWIRCARTVNF